MCNLYCTFAEITDHMQIHFPASPPDPPVAAAAGAGGAEESYDTAEAAAAASIAAAKRGKKSAAAVPKEAQLSSEQKTVVDAIMSGKSVFFTGSAGTGKSFLLQHLVRTVFRDEPGTFITASTGLAAVNIGGSTLHSWAGVGLAGNTPDKLADQVLKNRTACQRWMSTKRLVIDEISMIGGPLLDKFETMARIVRGSTKPFGGIQLILCGDFLQLPPVQEPRCAFEAECWNRCVAPGCMYQLTKVFRQDDEKFVDILQQLRVGICNDPTWNALKQCESTILKPAFGVLPSKLYAVRVDVDAENKTELAKLTGPPQVYQCLDEGVAPFLAQLNAGQARERLELKVGAQVILLTNADPKRGLMNGSRGIVIEFVKFGHEVKLPHHEYDKEGNLVAVPGATAATPKGTAAAAAETAGGGGGTGGGVTPIFLNSPAYLPEDKLETLHASGFADRELPVVQFSNGVVELILPHAWDIVSGGKLKAKRTQIPLNLAWALTIHKSQGQSLDCAEMSFSRVFEYGQMYVGVSRIKTLGGLKILSMERDKIRASPKIVRWYADNFPPTDYLTRALEGMRTPSYPQNGSGGGGGGGAGGDQKISKSASSSSSSSSSSSAAAAAAGGGGGFRSASSGIASGSASIRSPPPNAANGARSASTASAAAAKPPVRAASKPAAAAAAVLDFDDDLFLSQIDQIEDGMRKKSAAAAAASAAGSVTREATSSPQQPGTTTTKVFHMFSSSQQSAGASRSTTTTTILSTKTTTAGGPVPPAAARAPVMVSALAAIGGVPAVASPPASAAAAPDLYAPYVPAALPKSYSRSGGYNAGSQWRPPVPAPAPPPPPPVVRAPPSRVPLPSDSRQPIRRASAKAIPSTSAAAKSLKSFFGAGKAKSAAAAAPAVAVVATSSEPAPKFNLSSPPPAPPAQQASSSPSNGAESASGASSGSSVPMATCVVCNDRAPAFIILDCMHFVLCDVCQKLYRAVKPTGSGGGASTSPSGSLARSDSAPARGACAPAAASSSPADPSSTSYLSDCPMCREPIRALKQVFTA